MTKTKKQLKEEQTQKRFTIIDNTLLGVSVLNLVLFFLLMVLIMIIMAFFTTIYLIIFKMIMVRAFILAFIGYFLFKCSEISNKLVNKLIFLSAYICLIVYLSFGFATADIWKDWKDYKEDNYVITEGVVDRAKYSWLSRRHNSYSNKINYLNINEEFYNIQMLSVHEYEYKDKYKNKKVRIHYLKHSKIVTKIEVLDE